MPGTKGGGSESHGKPSGLKNREELADELNRNINPDPDGGATISGMTKRTGYQGFGTQTPIEGLDKDYRRKSSL